MRIWIDTDAAYGVSARTDPDDCWALLLLLRAPEIEVVGISTVFGNADVATVDATTRWLVRAAAEAVPPPVHRGATTPEASADTPAVGRLAAVLADAPLTVLALGPLTNIAGVLHRHPELSRRIERLVAVAGKRAGHLFHPGEATGRGGLFGHGPIFTDFNVRKDLAAASAVIASNVPLTLVPYEAARGLLMSKADLAEIAGPMPSARSWRGAVLDGCASGATRWGGRASCRST